METGASSGKDDSSKSKPDENVKQDGNKTQETKTITIEETRSETQHLVPGDLEQTIIEPKKRKSSLTTKFHRTAIKINVPVISKDRFDVHEMTPDIRTFHYKLGWIQGVLIPCLLNIWGVMLFLRIAWVVGQAGIAYSLIIIMLSCVVCLITTLSLSAIVTNGTVQGGGVYYLVSRSLGAELGASVGIMFALANAVAASMNTIGFCDSLNDLLRRWNWKIIDNGINDVRLVGSITLLLLCIICAIGMDWESKFQNFLIVIILLAIFNFILGVFIGPTSDKTRAQGFTGIKSEVAQRNWKSDFRYSEGMEHGFFSVFAIYFPAVTGVQAGANICGDLRDPASAIPKGTLGAVLISTISYLVMSLSCGLAGLRDASGDTQYARDYQELANCKPKCKYGLHNNYEMMQLMAAWDLLILFGCWAATLSTALTNLLAVPRLIQALGRDQIYPGLIYFSKAYGKHGEPYRGYVLVFLVSVAFLLVADLNTIAPLITNFYLASYALINFCTFHAAFVRHISWRPQFRYYNKWLCLLGFMLCVAIMMIISWAMALLTVMIFLTLYLIVLYKQPKQVKWGSSTEVQKYRETVTYILNVTTENEAIKSYNPQLLVMTGRPYLTPRLLHMGNLITKLGSFMIVADVETTHLPHEERLSRSVTGQQWLNNRNYRSFYVVIDGHTLDSAVKTLIQCAGLGRLSPNILLIGFYHHWFKRPVAKIATYFRTLQSAYDHQIGLTILRSEAAERAMRSKEQDSTKTDPSITRRDEVQSVLRADSNEVLTEEPGTSENQESPRTSELDLHVLEEQTKSNDVHELHATYSTHRYKRPFLDSVPIALEVGKIDAWWLYDDGGLNILIPYMISRRGFKDKVPLRIFSIAKKNDDKDSAYKRMENMLAKFRIEYEELIIFPSDQTEPDPTTWAIFHSLVTKFKSDSKSDVFISDEELNRLHNKTVFYLRVRELVLENCSNSTLVILTLPLPRKKDKIEKLGRSHLTKQTIPLIL